MSNLRCLDVDATLLRRIDARIMSFRRHVPSANFDGLFMGI